MERYCQLRLTGADPFDCMERAGYAMDQTADRRTLIKKANAYDRNPVIQDRITELKEKMSLQEGESQFPVPPSFFKNLDLDKNEMSKNWVNQAAYTVYRQAISVDNFHQCLQTLKFIAELNGFVEKDKGGRPKHDKAPNDTEAGFNHDAGVDTGSPEEDADFALEFAGADGSDGKESTCKGTPRQKIRTAARTRTQDPQDGDEGLDEFDKWDSGVDGEN